MTTTEVHFIKSGNTVGFTAAGENVCGKYMHKTKAWRVWVDRGFGGSLSDPRNRTFPKLSDAREYAAGLIDDEATERLAWW